MNEPGAENLGLDQRRDPREHPWRPERDHHRHDEGRTSVATAISSVCGFFRFHITSSRRRISFKSYQGLTMASRTIIDASVGVSIIELMPTQAFTRFNKVADNDTWASSGCLLPVQPTANVKGVLQVEEEDILEAKIDSLMQRLEKMGIEKKEA
jgi:hypothetical protein